MGTNELLILLTANDKASAVLRGAAGAITGALVGALSDAARAAAEDEANTRKLMAAVNASGVAYEDYQGRIGDVIQRGQDLAYTDDETRDSLSSLVQTTGSVEKAMQLNALAMELARGKGIDLSDASKIVGRVAEGNTGILSRYGIVLEKGASAQEALAALQKRFAGQAEGYGKSTQGFLDRVKDGLHEFSESIGKAMGPATGIIALLPGMSAGFSGVAGAVTFFSSAQNLATARTYAHALLMAPVTLATYAWSVAQGVLNAIMSANPIAIVILAVVALIAIFKIAYDHSEAFRKVVQAIWGGLQNLLKPLSFVADAVGALARAFGIGGSDIKTSADDTGVAIGDFSAQGSSDLGNFETNATGHLGAVRGQLQAMSYDVDALIQRFHDLVAAESGINPTPTSGGGQLNPGIFPQAEGGDYLVTRPTLFLAGDAGIERATFTPGGGSPAGGGGVTLVFNAPIYGMDDFNRQVVSAIRDARLVGGFRGVS